MEEMKVEKVVVHVCNAPDILGALLDHLGLTVELWTKTGKPPEFHFVGGKR
jgi:hypothetical protein